MNLDWGSIIGVAAAPFTGGASLALTAASAYGAYRSGRMAQDAGMASSQRQMDFQEYMSNTAHRREVSDLRQAGLNPILSATGGAGASSPGGASASGVDPSSAAAAREMMLATDAIRTGKYSRSLMHQQTETAEAQDKFLQEQTRTQRAETAGRTFDAIRRAQDAAAAGSARAVKEAEAERARLDLEVARRGQRGRLDQAEMESHQLYKAKRWADSGLETLGKALGGVVGGAVAGAITGRARGSSARSQSRGPVIRPYRRIPPVLPRALR